MLVLVLLLLLLCTQVDAQALTKAFCRQCFGRMLAVNEVQERGFGETLAHTLLLYLTSALHPTQLTL